MVRGLGSVSARHGSASRKQCHRADGTRNARGRRRLAAWGPCRLDTEALRAKTAIGPTAAPTPGVGRFLPDLRSEKLLNGSDSVFLDQCAVVSGAAQDMLAGGSADDAERGSRDEFGIPFYLGIPGNAVAGALRQICSAFQYRQVIPMKGCQSSADRVTPI